MRMTSGIILHLGHTADDQAETFLMRLARGAGVDGLKRNGQPSRHAQHGVTWLRPFLSEPNDQTLRSFLRVNRHQLVDDPSNDDAISKGCGSRRDALQCWTYWAWDVAHAVGGVAGQHGTGPRSLGLADFLAARDCATLLHGAVAIERKFRLLPEEIATPPFGPCDHMDQPGAPIRPDALQWRIDAFKAIRSGQGATLMAVPDNG